MISKVAPYDLIRRDFEHLSVTEELNTSAEIAELILIQSLEGRAHNGAGFFKKSFYVNTTIDDIVNALKLNPVEIKKRRQALIDDIVEFVKDSIKGAPRNKLLNSRGQPFLGVPDFKNIEVDARQVLKGIYIGGLRDDPAPRKAAEEKYSIVIGYGKCYLVSVEVMVRLNLDGEMLAHQAHADSLDNLKKQGLIISPEDLRNFAPEKLRYLYIRHALGPGQSDDAAIVASGLIYNKNVALGVFLADAIDTLEKYVLDYRDQDDELAYYIGENYPELSVSMDEVYDLAYLAAIPEGREEEIPDSSLRYLLSKDKQMGQCALESHFNFIQGNPCFPMLLSYNRSLSTEFYSYINNKVMSHKGQKEVITSETIIKNLSVPVEEFLKRRVVVGKPGISLKEAIDKMRSSGAEFMVIQDERNTIQGILSINDLLKLFIESGRKS
ncbi:MAG: CBS domain-containing protein [Candidatus Omnitrophota bacterium]